MKCPHCCIGIHLSTENTQVWKINNNDEELLGYRLTYGHCPACHNLIVMREQGQIKNIPQTNSNLFDVDLRNIQQEILYPKNINRKVEPEVPDNYRKDYLEAWSILYLSPRGSAVIIRRILQDVLHNEFDIKCKNLFQEIKKFIHEKDAPPHLKHMIDAVRSIGNFAAHPIEDIHTYEIVDVSVGEAELLIHLLDELFDFVFVQPKRMSLKRHEINEKLIASNKPLMQG
jgi:hypothetical protein